ncbi:MAG: hypothetical protein WBB17_14020, partial [Saprospiraceae bacterium]
IYITVLRSKNAFEKVPFLLVRFLWASKENERMWHKKTTLANLSKATNQKKCLIFFDYYH